jgi:hypothetical protein
LTTGRETDGRGEDEPVGGERGDVDELLVTVDDKACPEASARAPVERKDGGVGRAEDS